MRSYQIILKRCKLPKIFPRFCQNFYLVFSQNFAQPYLTKQKSSFSTDVISDLKKKSLFKHWYSAVSPKKKSLSLDGAVNPNMAPITGISIQLCLPHPLDTNYPKSVCNQYCA